MINIFYSNRNSTRERVSRNNKLSSSLQRSLVINKDFGGSKHNSSRFKRLPPTAHTPLNPLSSSAIWENCLHFHHSNSPNGESGWAEY